MAEPEASSPPQKSIVWFVPYLDESRPWRSRTRFPLKSDGLKFGVRDKRGRIAELATPEEFEKTLHDQGDLTNCQAAVPGHDRWFPATLLLQPVEGSDSRALSRIGMPLLITLILGWLYLAPPKQWPIAGAESRMFLLLALMFFGIMPLCPHLIQWWGSVRDRSPDREHRNRADAIFFDHWLQSFSSIVLKVSLLGLLLIYFLQVFGGIPKGSLSQNVINFIMGGGEVGDSVRKAALVKYKVDQGEWWRLGTAGVMHGLLPHILFNGSALYFLGRVTIGMVGSSLLGLVFLLSILGGSAASLMLSSGRASVGSSGGVMGILGFLTVIAILRRAGIPQRYKAILLQAILIMSIFGILGAQFIDNAAHGGGFLVGGLLGLLLVPRGERVWDHRPSQTVAVLGWMSWGVLLLAGIQVTRILLQ